MGLSLELIKTDYSTIGPDAPTLNDIFKEIEGYVFLDKQIPNFHLNKFHENAPLGNYKLMRHDALGNMYPMHTSCVCVCVLPSIHEL